MVRNIEDLKIKMICLVSVLYLQTSVGFFFS